MSTRARIGIAEGKNVRSIYLHFDGNHAGDILAKHYNTVDRIKKLLALGDISSLGSKIGKKHGFHQRPADTVTAYHRDRGDEMAPALVEAAGAYGTDRGIDYHYLFRGGKWVYAYAAGPWKPVSGPAQPAKPKQKRTRRATPSAPLMAPLFSLWGLGE